MTIEEAKNIIGRKYFKEDGISFSRNNYSWSAFTAEDDSITLDGYYSQEELEAFITLMKFHPEGGVKEK